MPDYDFPILPSTKIGVLLDRYPELEDILIGLAPPFKKLKTPLLRNRVAMVTSLKHAAAVGGMPVNDLVTILRASVGQEAIASEDAAGRSLTSPVSPNGSPQQRLWRQSTREPLIQTKCRLLPSSNRQPACKPGRCWS